MLLKVGTLCGDLEDDVEAEGDKSHTRGTVRGLLHSSGWDIIAGWTQWEIVDWGVTEGSRKVWRLELLSVLYMSRDQ